MTALGFRTRLESRKGADRERSFPTLRCLICSAILQAYENPSQASDFITKGQAHWLSVCQVLLEINSILPREDRSGFITLADLHAGAWFARILACVGAKDLKDIEGAFEKLIQEFGRSQEEVLALKNWWSTMVTRKSFQQIYADGLH